jgi:iron complex outermembrane receptor protein
LRHLLAAIVVVAPAAGAQEDSARVSLEPVVVTVARGSGRSVLGSPFALSVTRPDSMRPGLRQTGVDESLALIPGLSTTGRNNPSQDPRLSIRGFGARSAFGVRGIRVLRDGMPLTLPDGQTPLDYVSLESVGRVEVMRGSASALYGNASGGVIDLITEEPAPAGLAMDARQFFGDDDFRRTVGAFSGTSRSVSFIGDIAHLSNEGARDHSRQRATSGFGRAAYSGGYGRAWLSVMGLHNPLAQNPGALTMEEMRSNPEAADPQSLRRNARKAVRQLQVGAGYSRSVAGGTAAVSAFRGARSLDNPLPFAVVEIGRHTWGASATLDRAARVMRASHRFSIGAEFQAMNDLRRNYAACADTVARAVPTATCPDLTSDRGIVTLDQREQVSSLGVYLADEVELHDRVTASAGLRADDVRFTVRDRLVVGANPDDSGERSLRSLSPLAGVVVRTSALNSFYANVSSAFETPTATELGNQPDGSAGINRELEPQRSVTLEAGAKGFAGRLRYDAAMYTTGVTDELVPFEIPDSNGRRYFRNAGRTRRTGAELGGDISAGPVAVMAAWNYSRFRFDEFTAGNADFAGNRIPGIPEHRLQAAITLRGTGTFGVLETEVAGWSYADDANTFRAPGYSVFHLRAGYSPTRGSRRLSLTAGVQNVLDRTFASSLAVNAARSRYFEPAPRRTFFLGLSAGASVGSRE